MIVKIKNPNVSDNVETFISDDYTSGTTLNIQSSTSFANGNYILIGEPGHEKSEITNITAAVSSSTSLTITALNYSHAKGTPVYYLRWDKYNLEYRTSDAGSWTAYGLTTLKYDAKFTEYRDTSATANYSWRYRYYSSENSAYSDYSDTITASGWPKDSVGYLVRQVRKIINDPDAKTVTDTEIIRFFNEAQNKVYSAYDRWWFLLKQGTAISTEASTANYSLPSDLGRLHRVLYDYQDDTSDPTTDIKYNLRYLTNIEYEYEARDQLADDNDNVKYYTIYPGDSDNESGYLHVWPTPETAGLSMTPFYYKKMTDLDSYADETDIPIPSLLTDYALSQIYEIKKEEAKADRYDRLFREQLELLKLEQRKSARPSRSLWRWRGRRSQSRLFGTRSIYSDTTKENFW